jgi:hypothetical protein
MYFIPFSTKSLSLILRRTVRSVSKGEASPESTGSSFETPLPAAPQDEGNASWKSC